ncbi:MAG TPA: alpha/beta hydrolase [Jatrophihabitantaceae bacterium]|jgi:dienelactone hydrolase
MRGAAVLLLLLLAAGCSSSGHPAATPSPSPSPSTSTVANAKLNERCPIQTDGISAIPFMFRAGDGTKLLGLELGTGTRGVVLVHELGGGGLCGWLPYGSYLAAHGMHLLLYDTRCTGASSCPDGDRSGDIVSDVAGAAAELTRRGARSVAVTGASYGGAIALASAVRVRGMTACVVLSGDLWSQDLGGITGEQAARRLAVPLFYAVATQDGDRLATARRIVALVRPSLVTLQVLNGPAHGWDLLQDQASGRFTPLAAQVLEYLSTHLP